MSEILVEEYRGKLLENIHRGDIAVCSAEKKVTAFCGDTAKDVYYRSAAKPLQVLPVITSGAADKYGFTDKEIALMSASHSGEEFHIEILKNILSKMNLTVDDLRCGSHPPFSRSARKHLRENDLPITQAHNACSGKHSAQLALAKFYGWDMDTYYKKEHPVQQLLLKTISEVADYPEEKIYQGIDGCGVVVFGLPLKNIAYSYFLLENTEFLDKKYRKAADRIVRVMKEYPAVIAGTDRFGTLLCQTLSKNILAKSGADGVFALAFDDKGIAVKIEDGKLPAAYPVVIDILKKYDVITDEEIEKLDKYYRPVIKDHNGRKAGYIRANFALTANK
ncbi:MULTISPECIES: asparaginase [unclassified Halanaerobium]|uniref:asparaginase n=1 Tax=unclassified Halanaerobium TaxID=2641197 RepID=UPI000DF3CDBA|nr:MULTISPECIES: asparaginase [unclassified Halanaerobium]RCW42003.1 asparaginase [Halanaerobium sp. MA284_MarDTE_T2]RCW79964.1 asparaginase [Halanaerobium sp. DL-01]